MGSILTCDVCGSTGAETVTITWRGRSFIVDLCEKETPTLDLWEQGGSETPRKRAVSRTKQKGHSVTPID